MRTLLTGSSVHYILFIRVKDQRDFALTSPGESARLWFPWRTRVSSEGNEADWLSPLAESGSQTAPGGWTPDNPVNQGEEEDKLE